MIVGQRVHRPQATPASATVHILRRLTTREAPLSTIDERFITLHSRSAELAGEARQIFPGGVTHDIRHFEPFGLYVDRAEGARKWDVDGNEIIDYVMGHGALLLGHAHPTLTEAVKGQIARGTHYGASHTLEIAWARAIQSLLPSAERVRFVSSGTEATMMAVRLARAFSGRSRLLKLRHHFHGWNDTISAGGPSARDSYGSVGVPPEWAGSIEIFDQHDLEAIGAALARRDFAAVILEPTGYSWGTGPLDPAVPAFLRDRTRETGTILIFDEVITGFRASMGGAQARLQIQPDLTTLAKIVAGGLPGGVVAGRADLLDQIAIDPDRPPSKRVGHPGTFNANPLSAVAGAAMLAEVATGVPNETADARAAQLTRGMNAVIRRAEVPGAAYRDASMVHLLLGHEVDPPLGDQYWNWGAAGPGARVPHTPTRVVWPFSRAMLNHGVDLIHMGAMVSAVHSEADVEATLEAFEASLADLRAEAIL